MGASSALHGPAAIGAAAPGGHSAYTPPSTYGGGYGGGFGGYGGYGSGYGGAYGSGYGGTYGGYGGGAYGGYGGGYGRPNFLGGLSPAGGFLGQPPPGEISGLLPDSLGGGLRSIEQAMVRRAPHSRPRPTVGRRMAVPWPCCAPAHVPLAPRVPCPRPTPCGRAQFTFGRLTQLLEMNFETLHHFLGALGAFAERVRAVSGEFSSLGVSVRRQSIEFGEASVARLHQLRGRPRRLAAVLLLVLALVLRAVLRARGSRGAPRGRTTRRLRLESAWEAPRSHS